jgi:hypothetical protein
MKFTTTRINSITQEERSYEISVDPEQQEGRDGKEVTVFYEASTGNCINLYYSEAQVEQELAKRADNDLRFSESRARFLLREKAFKAQYGNWFQDEPIYRALIEELAVGLDVDLSEFASESEAKAALKPTLSDAKASLRSEHSGEYRDANDKEEFYLSYIDEMAREISF